IYPVSALDTSNQFLQMLLLLPFSVSAAKICVVLMVGNKHDLNLIEPRQINRRIKMPELQIQVLTKLSKPVRSQVFQVGIGHDPLKSGVWLLWDPRRHNHPLDQFDLFSTDWILGQ